MARQNPLAGKVAVVVGGSGGIGAATARLLAEEGASVVVTYRTDAARAVSVPESSTVAGFTKPVPANDNRHLARERILPGHARAHLMGGAGSTDWPGSITNV